VTTAANANGIVAAKAVLRNSVLAARAALPEPDRADAGERIARHGLARWSAVRTVAGYLAVGAEPPTRRLLDGLVDEGVRVLLPVIDGDGLDWAPYDGPHALVEGPLGINEPTGARLGAAALSSVELVLVPALAVDRLGRRLGRGRGYYDRALAGYDGETVAVVYDTELIETVPIEAHDRPVRAVLRPAGLTSVPTERPDGRRSPQPAG
jgi:5-formyltetrahydrofolate cyclo-ligase